jgi:hypothetical protein
MADRGHADADQVVARQLRQHFTVDVVVAKGWRILREAQPAQPLGDIHGHNPAARCAERNPYKEGAIDSSVGRTMTVNGYRGQRRQLAFP